MTERVQKLLKNLRSDAYKAYRSEEPLLLDSKNEDKDIYFKQFLEAEQPTMPEGDRIGFYLSHKNLPTYYGCDADGNFIPNYKTHLTKGMGGIYEDIKARMETADPEQKVFAETALSDLEAIFAYCDKYKNAASGDLKKALETVPYHAPTSYYEALVFLRILIHLQRINYTIHVTLGRFDQYMYPFYKMDVQRGVSHDEILELTEEFFISLNVDADLYPGIQQGDNGQAMVLGGTNPDGSSAFNELSRICMEASLELNLIDPKINLRVNKDTPFSLYRFGTELTKQGMGFPQYCNDDVIIPGLIELGYDPEDAYNYGVAACWECIVPDVSDDTPNIRAMNFPKVVNTAIHNNLADAKTLDDFLDAVKKELATECDRLIESVEYDETPSVLHSLFLDPCIEHLKQFTTGICKYNNIGFHGVGISNAADALMAVKKCVFEEKSITPDDLIAALNADFEGYEDMRKSLLTCPKMGNNDDEPDELGCLLMECFSETLRNRRDKRGNRIRPGTGSAMYYLWCADEVGATADGRHAQQPFGCSFSPSVTAKLSGPLSVVQSFTKFDMKKIINGGPLTMEIHENTFRNEDGIDKVAYLVKSFVELGGHQFQLNAINRDRLLDAQKHPEKYPNLIVRVWGWSGYFNELDVRYQNHIIARSEFSFA